MRALKYFMWGFQPHFRSSLQLGAEYLLKQIGSPAKPVAVLVGFAATDQATWPICIEPEHRFFQPEHLASVDARGAELYEHHPRSQMWYSDQRSQQLIHEGLRDECRAIALAEALGGADPDGVTYFAGRSARVGEYEVHPVLGLPKRELLAVPHLDTDVHDDVNVVPSLVHGCVEVLLTAARRALYEPDAGAGLQVLGATTEELARRAAGRLVADAVRRTDSIHGESLFGGLSAVATTRYEGEAGFGSIIAAAAQDDDLDIAVRLRVPVSFSDVRAVRKLLEISDRNRVALLTDGSAVYGLGRVADSYDPSRERIFEFDVVGEGKWLTRHAQTVLLDVEFGLPRLPRPRIDRERFDDTVARVFGASAPDPTPLWHLAMAAADQAHGTMLVISAAAALEAERLSAQAILIEETELPAALLSQATSIDGAVLFGPKGVCHALGVILDGVAAEEGDRARGSRFNTAVRYLAGATAATMIVLVSEDGMIDVLPNLRRRITREALEEAVDRYVRLTTAADVDRELRAEALEHIEELEFYLSAEQCELINRVEAEFQDAELAAGRIKLTRRPFAVDPVMDDSYFL